MARALERARRCLFCGKKLREDGYCINVDCVDYERTRIHDETNGEQAGTNAETVK